MNNSPKIIAVENVPEVFSPERDALGRILPGSDEPEGQTTT